MIGERPPVAANLILPILIKPVLNKVENQSHEAALDLKMALLKAESAFPGLILELITKLAGHIDPNINMTKSLLSLQGSVPDSEEYRSDRKEGLFVDLNRRASALKKILSRIPNEIGDRKVFLETIKEVASAIKKLLDCLTEVINVTQSASCKQTLEDRKRDFIKCSKRFSNKLKEFFKEGQAQSVFISAAHLINQIYAIQLTIKLFDSG